MRCKTCGYDGDGGWDLYYPIKCPVCRKSPDETPMKTIEEEILEEFDEKFCTQESDPSFVSTEDGDLYESEEIKSFLRQAIEKAKREERERIALEVGTFKPINWSNMWSRDFDRGIDYGVAIMRSRVLGVIRKK